MPASVSWVRLEFWRVLPIMLLCMMANATAPRGYMPSMTADGFHLVLCAGVVDTATIAAMADEPAAAALANALKQSQDQHGDDGDEAPTACPFAGAAIVDLPSLAAVSAPIVHAQTAPLLPPGAIIRARHHAATPPATGPPHLI